VTSDGLPRAVYAGLPASNRQRLEILLSKWSEEIRAWRIPEQIRSQAQDEPRLTRRIPDANGAVSVPTGSRSFVREREALAPAGSVLDVGAGTGDAALALAGEASEVIAVDINLQQLEVLEHRGRELGVPVRTVHGRWPDVADRVAPCDIVVCHYVVYEVEDLGPFLAALTSHAGRRVVLTVPVHHPQAALTPLWRHFHGLRRPDGPAASDVADIAEAMGLNPITELWMDVDGFGGYGSFEEMVDRTRRRLCLPVERGGEVAEQLIALGVDPAQPKSLGTVGREIATIWWQATG
jgi:2-polyprenyl-3-methyl-5-hydroxy-6-metoxy-1,4-benzoquinol methylase